MIYCIYMFHYLFFNLLLWFQSWPNFIGSSLTRELDGGEEEEAWRTYPPLWCPSPCFPVTYLVIDKCVAVWTRDITVRKHFTARVQYNSVVFVCNLYLYYILFSFDCIDRKIREARVIFIRKLETRVYNNNLKKSSCV